MALQLVDQVPGGIAGEQLVGVLADDFGQMSGVTTLAGSNTV